MVPLSADLVVLVRFPFSDLSQTKLRPPVVLADAGRGDWILCQVNSKSYAECRSCSGDRGFPARFASVKSYARPGKLFTASGDLMESVAGALQPGSLRGVVAAVVTIPGGRRPSL